MKRYSFVFVVLLFGFILPANALAGWTQPSAGPLNNVVSSDDVGGITTIGGVPYVTWSENDGNNLKVFVKRFIDGGWVQVGGPLNIDPINKNAFWSAITNIGGVPYVTWLESDGNNKQVFVKKLVNNAWVQVGGSLNIDPATKLIFPPTIADVNRSPYVAWSESTGTSEQVFVKKFVNNAWVQVGGSLNIDPTMHAYIPMVADVGGIPYVAWIESNNINFNYQVFVKKFVNNAWVQVGGSLNIDPTENISNPARIASVGGVPYVTWAEHSNTVVHVFVKKFVNNAWVQVGGPLNIDPTKHASEPMVINIGGVPYVTWREDRGNHYEVFVKRLVNDAWTQVGGSLNIDPTKDASDPMVTSVGGVPYVALFENDSLVRVVRLEPDFLAEDATPSATGVVLSAKINDYGVPLPVGFEHGLTDVFGTQTALQTTSGQGISTVTETVNGLQPATNYSYRAYGSDIFRQTSLGATQSFTTPSLPSQPPSLGTTQIPSLPLRSPVMCVVPKALKFKKPVQANKAISRAKKALKKAHCGYKKIKPKRKTKVKSVTFKPKSRSKRPANTKIVIKLRLVHKR